MAEGFNNVVGTIKKQAYGFHDRDYLKLKILRICGKLEWTDFVRVVLRRTCQTIPEDPQKSPRLSRTCDVRR